ncbi:hypothetical protein [Brevundimonas sp. Leaf363]|nr:hypothetical protein [Brevundimonas sp. Leaf363]
MIATALIPDALSPSEENILRLLSQAHAAKSIASRRGPSDVAV